MPTIVETAEICVYPPDRKPKDRPVVAGLVDPEGLPQSAAGSAETRKIVSLAVSSGNRKEEIHENEKVNNQGEASAKCFARGCQLDTSGTCSGCRRDFCGGCLETHWPCPRNEEERRATDGMLAAQEKAAQQNGLVSKPPEASETVRSGSTAQAHQTPEEELRDLFSGEEITLEDLLTEGTWPPEEEAVAALEEWHEMRHEKSEAYTVGDEYKDVNEGDAEDWKDNCASPGCEEHALGRCRSCGDHLCEGHADFQGRDECWRCRTEDSLFEETEVEANEEKPPPQPSQGGSSQDQPTAEPPTAPGASPEPTVLLEGEKEGTTGPPSLQSDSSDQLVSKPKPQRKVSSSEGPGASTPPEPPQTVMVTEQADTTGVPTRTLQKMTGKAIQRHLLFLSGLFATMGEVTGDPDEVAGQICSPTADAVSWQRVLRQEQKRCVGQHHVSSWNLSKAEDRSEHLRSVKAMQPRCVVVNEPQEIGDRCTEVHFAGDAEIRGRSAKEVADYVRYQGKLTRLQHERNNVVAWLSERPGQIEWQRKEAKRQGLFEVRAEDESMVCFASTPELGAVAVRSYSSMQERDVAICPQANREHRTRWKEEHENRRNQTKIETAMLDLISFLEADEELVAWNEEYANSKEDASMQDHSPSGSSAPEGAPVEAIRRALRKLHESLGHPQKGDLLIILVHGGASPLALKEARESKCSVCEEHTRATPARNAQVPKDYPPLSRVSMDLKWLPGWKKGQRLRCLNIICMGSKCQVFVPFQEGGSEDSETIRKYYYRHWVRVFGSPDELVVDPAGAHLSQEFQEALAGDGTTLRPTAGQAHWQQSLCERHGQIVERKFTKCLAAVLPRGQQEWEFALDSFMSGKNRTVLEHGYSPCQHLFGRQPRIPCELEDEQECVVSRALSHASDSFSRAHEIRALARYPLLETADGKAMIVSSDGAPRPCREYSCGDTVAYWRGAHKGKGVKVGRPFWYGRALVCGKDGRNLLLTHGGTLLRAAPEQVRPITKEEQEGDRISDDLRTAAESVRRQQLAGGGVKDLTTEDYPDGENRTTAEPSSSSSAAAPSSTPATASSTTTPTAPSTTPTTAPSTSGPESGSGEMPASPTTPEEFFERLLKKLGRTRWASDDEVAYYTQYLNTEADVVDKIRLSIRPKAHLTPRPYIPDGRGEYRQRFGCWTRTSWR